MAEGGRTKRHTFGLIKYEIHLKYEKNLFHFCIKIRERKETFSLTQ